MISAILYYPVYLLILTVLTFAVYPKYSRYSLDRFQPSNAENIFPALILTVFITVYIGIRPVSGIFMDMVGVSIEWDMWDEGTFHFSLDRTNFLYDNLRAFMATSGMPVEWLFMLMSVIYYGNMLVAVRKIFPNDTLFVMLMVMAAFSTFSYGANGFKAGAAASIFLVALAYHDNLKISIPMAIISWGFHHSMIVVLLAFLCVKIYNNPKAYFFLWVFSFFMGLFHITFFQNFFAEFLDDHSAEYLDSEWGSGFRINFILYSAVPLVVGYWTVFKKKLQSKEYNTILSLYLFVNSLWLLCIYAEFTNRIAYLSWFMYSIVLIYPFLKIECGERQFHTAKLVGYGHLAFSLFMCFIYYGYIH